MASIDIRVFDGLANDGLVSKRQHPTAPLLIWNYTNKTAYGRLWTDETMMARGLITKLDGEIVARPFRKFFNVEEWIAMGRDVPREPFEVFEKLDGSLGILYFVGNEAFIASRGSFDSQQAREGTRLLRLYGPAAMWPRDYTFLFEILYPENRIVCNYGDRRDLVLLAVIETATGRDVPLHVFDGAATPTARRFDGVTAIESIREFGSANEEGFVVRFQSGLRLKIKLPEYVRLHRLLTGVTPRRVWEILSKGESLDTFMRDVPEEFSDWLRNVSATLRAEYDKILNRCIVDFDSIPPKASRKEQAEIAKACPYPAVLFRMLDGKDASPLIWKAIYPPPANAFRCDADGV